jgi:sugar/nucleoside kinase (ribokinase family)
MHTFDVFGIGNSIMDVVAQVEDELLDELNIPKGVMTLVDQQRSAQLLASLTLVEKSIIPGGSCCNTMIGIANLGGKSVYAGAIGDDAFGVQFKQQLVKFGVVPSLFHTDGMTGSSIILVTPDSERSMNTHLGVCGLLEKKHIMREEIRQSRILHTTAYLYDTCEETCIYALETAKRQNIPISIDLSDPFLIRQRKKDLQELIHEYADLVFLNQEESWLFTGKSPEQALAEIGKTCRCVCLKLGANGSLIRYNNKKYIIQPYRVKPHDTTGAGDMYAAGFLFGITHNYTIEQSGKIASYAASKVVEVIGARIDYLLTEDIRARFGKPPSA